MTCQSGAFVRPIGCLATVGRGRIVALCGAAQNVGRLSFIGDDALLALLVVAEAASLIGGLR